VGQRTVPTGVEDDVEPLPTAGDVVERVVDDVVCAHGTDHVHLRRAADSSDVRSERLGDLHGERPDAS